MHVLLMMAFPYTAPIFLVTLIFVQLSSSASSPPPVNCPVSDSSPCNISSSWQPTPDAYYCASTNHNLQTLLNNVSLGDGGRLDNALGRQWGDNFQCGIGAVCSSPSCFQLTANDDPPWPYLASVSFQNLNTMFNVIYDGIGLGQQDFTDVTDDLADNFFHWLDPVYVGTEIAEWVGAAVSVICGFGSFGAARALEAGVILPTLITSLGTFANVGAQQVAQSLEPAIQANREVGIRQLKDAAEVFGEAARNSTESWATSTFRGLPQALPNGTNITILDYLQSGSFVNHALVPNSTQVELYYKSALIARAINSAWRVKPIYLVTTTTNFSSPDDYPSDASWYSPTTGRTFAPYYYDGRAQQQPPGLQLLAAAQYGIEPKQIAQAAGRAWEVAGNSYTSDVASQRLQTAFSSDGLLTPFQDGPGWEGMFTLPACDVGSQSAWLAPYGSKLLPCCCGTNCNDTRAFVQAANLNTSADFFDACRTQLQHTDLDFNSIDYGIDAGSAAHQFWHRLGKAKKAGFVIGLVFGAYFVLMIFASMCS